MWGAFAHVRCGCLLQNVTKRINLHGAKVVLKGEEIHLTLQEGDVIKLRQAWPACFFRRP